MPLLDQSGQFADGLNTFQFADEGGLVAARRRGIQDHLAGPLRLIAPRGAIEGVGNINLTGAVAVTGNVAAGGNVTATNVTASGAVAGNTVAATTNITAGGNVTATGDVSAANLSGSGTGTVAGKLTGQRLVANLTGTNPLPTLSGGLGTTPNVTAEIGDHTQGSLLFGTSTLGEPEVQAQALNVVKNLRLNPQGGDVYAGIHKLSGAALGLLGSNSRSTNSSAFTSIIYPLSVTVTLPASRKVRVRVHANVQSPNANASVSLSVCNGAGTILNQAYRICSLADAAEQLSCEWEGTSGAGGSTTYQLGVYANLSSLLVAGGTALAMIAVFDEGAA